jgi:hypothetical protein
MRITLLALSFIFAAGTQAHAAISIEGASDQTIGLGATSSFTLNVKADADTQAVFSIDAGALAAQDADHEVSFAVAPQRLSLTAGQAAQVKVTISTKISAPSFTGGMVALIARTSSETATATIGVNVQAVWAIHVVQKREGHCSDNTKVTDYKSWICDFDTPTDTAYLRAHAEGLQVEFHNDTQDTFLIHGSDAIQHGMKAIGPGEVYQPPKIMGTPADLKGGYTLHEIYRPSRDAVFNASRILQVR